jgi:plastocyanin
MSGATRAVSIITLLGIVAACEGDPVGQPVTEQGQILSTTDAALAALNAQDAHGRRHVAMLDDCSTDPAWNNTGGCALRGGTVSEAEFSAFLISPLALSVVGHPAWRNEPSYLRVPEGTTVRVSNDGGRNHTFTPVAEFGGGRVPPLNAGLTAAPECAPASPDPHQVAPGGRLDLDNLAPGTHRYQCCFHPWMRALVKVQ